MNKANTKQVVVEPAGRVHDKSLSYNFLSGIGLLKNLVTVLSRFWQGKYAAIADIEAIFHQIQIPHINTNSMKFLWRHDSLTKMEDSAMTAHVLGTTESL